jgi:hypothetical protein
MLVNSRIDTGPAGPQDANARLAGFLRLAVWPGALPHPALNDVTRPIFKGPCGGLS